MSAKLDLVCVDGPMQGERIQLSANGRIMFGRSKRGVHLADPQVSLEHAEISCARDRVSVTDLGSVSGTYINAKRLGREAMELQSGQTLKIGESLFRLEERPEGRLWLIPAVTVVALVGAIAAYAAWQLATPVVYAPALVFAEPVRRPGGLADRVVEIPLAFVRAEGVDQTGLSIRRVTDYDADGIDEMWLTTADTEYVVTFAETDWHLLGRVPAGCADRPGGAFPHLRCGSDLWVYQGDNYALASAEGITAWIDWTPPAPGPDLPAPPKPSGPTPFRVGQVDREALAGFLSVRGVEEPVQYLICEEALPGVAAQVLTASGRVRPLDYGCIRDVKLLGDSEITGEIPVAMAFTAAGRLALLDDLREFLSGSPDGLFLDEASAPMISAMSVNPVLRLIMRASFVGSRVPADLVATERPIAGRRSLLPNSTGRAAPRAEVVTITEPVTRIDPPGCSELEVRVVEWYCVMTKMCMPNQTAIEVEQLGCGAPAMLVTAPYTGGVRAGADSNIELRLAVDSHGGAGRVDVLRARIGWREIAAP